jgi:hypothetical protein
LLAGNGRVRFLAMRPVVLVLLAIFLSTFGCKGDDQDDDGGVADTGANDTGTADTGVDSGVNDTGLRDTGTVDSGPETAIIVEVGDVYGEAEVINPEGDIDLFQFQGVSGNWLRIITRSGGSPVDPVITLFDGDMNQLAESDDDIPRTGTDSEINFHVPADGTYFVQVQEFSTWSGGEAVGGPDYTYSLRILLWDEAVDGVVIDPENGDDAPSAVQEEFGTVLGTFRDSSDVDVYRVRIASSTTARYDVEILPQGPDGQGATTPAGDVWFTNLDGTETIARVNQAEGAPSLEPAVNPGEYLLWIAHPGTGGGDNDFYVLRPGLFGENNLERGDPANNALGGAEVLEITDDGTTRAAFVLARLNNGDVDYFLFPVDVGEELSVACGAQSSGSGVRGLTVEVRDRNDATIQTQLEGADGVFIEPFVPTSTGTYYVRLSAGAPDPEVTSRFVRCGLRAALPPP